jgi:hypothetical protein
MSNMASIFFGPLNSEACLYFYFLSVFFFFLLLVSICFFIILVIKKGKQIDMKILMDTFLFGFNIFIAYFVNRLLYTMCSKSLL